MDSATAYRILGARGQRFFVALDRSHAHLRAEGRAPGACRARGFVGSSSAPKARTDNHPINCVDWGQSVTYCHAQGKRLPTTQEWEWAARGGSQGRTYPWGNAAPDFQLCWSGVQKREGTCAVGSFPAGDAPGGIHDLAGNVFEWTQSNLNATGTARVIRGGAWYVVGASYVRAAYWPGAATDHRNNSLGFRCAR